MSQFRPYQCVIITAPHRGQSIDARMVTLTGRYGNFLKDNPDGSCDVEFIIGGRRHVLLVPPEDLAPYTKTRADRQREHRNAPKCACGNARSVDKTMCSRCEERLARQAADQAAMQRQWEREERELARKEEAEAKRKAQFDSLRRDLDEARDIQDLRRVLEFVLDTLEGSNG